MILLFASTNQHKTEEIKSMLPSGINLKNLKDIHWTEEIPEPFDTFQANAAAKTSFLFERTGLVCFAEDSGLKIDALNGRPGVYSARYAGVHGDSLQNINKVLFEMSGVENRKARFISCIAYQSELQKHSFFEDNVEGSIATEIKGVGGFGYDPIFIPEGFSQTFSQLKEQIKNKISHRAKSMRQFLDYLAQNR